MVRSANGPRQLVYLDTFHSGDVRRCPVLGDLGATNSQLDFALCLTKYIAMSMVALNQEHWRAGRKFARIACALFDRYTGHGGRSYRDYDMVHVPDVDPRIARHCLHAGRLQAGA